MSSILSTSRCSSWADPLKTCIHLGDMPELLPHRTLWTSLLASHWRHCLRCLHVCHWRSRLRVARSRCRDRPCYYYLHVGLRPGSPSSRLIGTQVLVGSILQRLVRTLGLRFLGRDFDAAASSQDDQCGGRNDRAGQFDLELLHTVDAFCHRSKLGNQGYRTVLRRHWSHRDGHHLFLHTVSDLDRQKLASGADLCSETKGRSYIELDELFARKIPARQFAKTKTAAQNALELQEGKDVPA